MAEVLPLPSDVLFIRHGRFAGNVVTTATGEEAMLVSALPPEDNFRVGLDNVGKQQALALGQHVLRILPRELIRVCMSADFTRVMETADLSLPDLPTVIDPRLRERDRGDVAGMPKDKFRALYPALAKEKDRSPLDWRPPNGETLWEKASEVRSLIPLMAKLAPNQPLPVFTSGEVVIAARSLPEFGNMNNEDLLRGIVDGWPGAGVDNAQFDCYTRRNPHDSHAPLSDTYDWMLSVRAAESVATDSGWIPIRRHQ